MDKTMHIRQTEGVKETKRRWMRAESGSERQFAWHLCFCESTISEARPHRDGGMSGSLFLCQSEYVISCGTSVNAAGREEKTPEFRHRCKAINENRKVGIN